VYAELSNISPYRYSIALRCPSLPSPPVTWRNFIQDTRELTLEIYRALIIIFLTLPFLKWVLQEPVAGRPGYRPPKQDQASPSQHFNKLAHRGGEGGKSP